MYKLLRSTIKSSDWRGQFNSLAEAKRVKKELEKEGVGVYRIIKSKNYEKNNNYSRFISRQ